jgi:two-component system NtrC family sensor kinase
MIKAPIPCSETERLKALIDYQILDTLPEQDFDDLTKTASIICKTPIALISLIDKDRQWFKSAVGLDAKETSREISFCGHAIHQSDVFLVRNSLIDERFSDNPLVKEGLKIRFYAGAPLISSSGYAIGTICVIDQVSRELTEEQQMVLKTLSKQVVMQLELRKALKKTQLDFTELQRLSKTVLEQQELIKKNEKLALIGELTSGVAHEINNPLAIINSAAFVATSMLASLEKPALIIKELNKIKITVERLGLISKALRTIADEPAENFNDLKSVEEKFYKIMDEARKA